MYEQILAKSIPKLYCPVLLLVQIQIYFGLVEKKIRTEVIFGQVLNYLDYIDQNILVPAQIYSEPIEGQIRMLRNPKVP